MYAHSPHHLPKKDTQKQPVIHIGSSDEPPNINFQLVNLHLRVNFHIHISGMLQDMGTAVNRLLAGLISIRNNVDKIYEYMRVMATHKVHPALLPPDPLRELLRHIKDKMRENPRLELPYDPDKSIWRYYEIMKITPIIVEDLMVVSADHPFDR